MTTFRTNRLFLLLMIGAVVAACFIPNRVSDRGRAHVQALFAPVALPTRWATSLVHGWLWPTRTRDEASPEAPRARDVVYAENDRLRVELANLAGQLEHYRLLAGDRQSMGALAERCDRFTVMGADSGARRTLRLVGRGGGTLREGMPVLAPGMPPGVIGRVAHPGTASASVLLLSDRQSVVTGTFGRPVTDDTARPSFMLLALPPTLVHGTGAPQLLSDKLPMKDVESAGLQPGDWLVLDDPSWPADLKGYRVGRVAKIAPSRENVLFAQIDIEPLFDPLQLREVLVLTRQ